MIRAETVRTIAHTFVLLAQIMDSGALVLMECISWIIMNAFVIHRGGQDQTELSAIA